jgi:transcriptional regulator with XRE-family HTH domain
MGERDIYREFGRKVADFRHEAHLTQADLARKIGVSRASLANIERGEQRVFLHQLLNIAATLNIQNIRDLLPALAASRSNARADVTVSGDRLSKAQERVIKELVSSITATSRRIRK